MPQAALRELLALGKLDGGALAGFRCDRARHGTGQARRAREGGSWLVRVALARTGKWIVDRGSVDAESAPARWAQPPVPLGHHRPEWP